MGVRVVPILGEIEPRRVVMVMTSRPKKLDHSYEVLRGEALDMHMMAEHYWDASMVALRGTQTVAQDSNYIGNMHEIAHHRRRFTSEQEPSNG
jgi:hypothetical protein